MTVTIAAVAAAGGGEAELGQEPRARQATGSGDQWKGEGGQPGNSTSKVRRATCRERQMGVEVGRETERDRPSLIQLSYRHSHRQSEFGPPRQLSRAGRSHAPSDTMSQ